MKVYISMSIFQFILVVVFLIKVPCKLQMMLSEHYRENQCFVKQVWASLWNRSKGPLWYGHIRVYGTLPDLYPLTVEGGCTKSLVLFNLFYAACYCYEASILTYKILMRLALVHQHKTPEQW